MNFVGHIELARLPDAPTEVDYLLGAALPDLAAIGRFRLLERPGNDRMAAGVDHHHRVDEAFHRHPWFRANSQAVSAGLEAAGLPRGAAMACGHVGVELLLDGHLLRGRPGLRQAAQAAVQAAGSSVGELEGLVDGGRRGAWRSHLVRVSRWPVPGDYHEAGSVAARLQRILSQRRRLSFGVEGIDAVAQVLDGRQSAIEDGAESLLTDLADQLAS